MISSISTASSQAQSALASAQSQMNMAKLTSLADSGTQAAKDKNMQQIDKTSQDFEAVFITEMLKPIFAMVPVDGEFGGGKGEEVFRDFTLNEYGKKMAAQGGFGIAPQIKAQLLRLQEAKGDKHAAA